MLHLLRSAYPLLFTFINTAILHTETVSRGGLSIKNRTNEERHRPFFLRTQVLLSGV